MGLLRALAGGGEAFGAGGGDELEEVFGGLGGGVGAEEGGGFDGAEGMLEEQAVEALEFETGGAVDAGAA